jgi:hypothetical protein
MAITQTTRFGERTAEAATPPRKRPRNKPIMIRVPPAALSGIDWGAERFGVSRSAFLILTAMQKVESMRSPGR